MHATMNFIAKSLLWMGVAVGLVAGTCGVRAQAPAVAGPEHQELKWREGTWDALIKSGGSESKGVATYKMECAGLWLVSEFKGDFGGQAFQGRGLDGYDPEKKKYVSVWVDSMSARPMLLEGEMDKEKKVLTLIGEGPGMDGKPAKFKSVTRRVDDNHETFKMSVVGADGAEMEMITIEYTRRK